MRVPKLAGSNALTWLLSWIAACGGDEFRAGDESSVSTSGGSAPFMNSGGIVGTASGGDNAPSSGGTLASGGSGPGTTTGGSGAANNVGGTGGVMTGVCAELWRDYLADLEQARPCELVSTRNECSTTLTGECACQVPVNPHTEKYEIAAQAYGRFLKQAASCPHVVRLVGAARPAMPSVKHNSAA